MEAMGKLKGKIFLVTGGTGFVGSHLVESLISEGSRVIVPFRSLDPSSYFTTQKLAKKVTLVSGDLKDFSRMFDIVTKYEIYYIFHLGAQAIVTTAYNNPRETIVTNVLGTTNILEAARLYGRVKGIIVASSDKAYGKSTGKYVESDPLRGDHPYEVSKSSADLISFAYAKTYNMPIVVTRFGNIYGEGDLNFNRIIPSVLKSIITNSMLEVRSDGTFVRDYVYIKDVVAGYRVLLDHIDKVGGEAYNFSSDDSLTVLEVIKTIETILKKKVQYSILNTQQNEIPYQSLNFDKVKGLGYAPSYTLKKILAKVYLWYLNNI
mgnify:CR=1 FL=1